MSAAASPADLRYAWRVLSVLSLGSILFALGTSSLNVALPEVVRHFRAGPDAASWMLLSFMLTTTVLMVTFGRLADMFGRRTMYLAGLAVYTLSALLLGLSTGPWVVVALRVVQAAGGAMILANGAALLGDAFPRTHLGRGMGIYVASFSVAQLVGPTLGGLLAHEFGWRWVFWYAVPIGVLGLIWGLLVLRRPTGRSERQRLDIPGNVLVLLGFGSLLFGLCEASERGWTDPWVVGGLVAGVLLMPLFVWVEHRSPHPVVDLRLFREPTLTWGIVASFANAVARMAVVVLMALYFQAVLGEDMVSAAIKVLPMPLATMLASMSSGLLQQRFSARAVAGTGAVVTTIGLLVLIATVAPGAGYPAVAVGLVLSGVGSGLFMPANTTDILHDVPSNRLGIVNGVRMLGTNTGIMLSTAVAFPLVTAPITPGLREHVFAGTFSAVSPVGPLVAGYRLTLAVMAVVSLVAVVAALRSPRRPAVAAPPSVAAPGPLEDPRGIPLEDPARGQGEDAAEHHEWHLPQHAGRQ